MLKVFIKIICRPQKSRETIPLTTFSKQIEKLS